MALRSTFWLFAALISTAVGQTVHAPKYNGSTPAPDDLLIQGIKALGGPTNISQVVAVAYVGGQIFRTRSLMEAYSLTGVDQAVSTTGRQNVSFSYDGPHIKQRIDRFHQLGALWMFTRPLLEPIDYSMVVQGGDEGFAAVVEGSFTMFAPSAPPSGYTDGLLAAFLISEAYKMSPLLLSTILSNNNYTLREEDSGVGVQLPAVYDEVLGLAVMFDPETSLPCIIRSFENHDIFGSSTHDLLVSDYTPVNGVMFPRRFKTVYNGRHLIADYVVEEVLVNPSLDSALFEGPGDRLETHIPTHNTLYDFAEIGEWSGAYIWGGEYTGTLANLSAIRPFPDLPGLWTLTFRDAPAYRQVVLEIEDSVVVLDCPPHQSLHVLQWARESLGKSVTHVWPSHHHHDHALGLKDYVAAGAKVIALDQAQGYYSNITGIQFLTYTTDEPLALNDGQMQARFIHMQGSLHALDHSYATISPTCITVNSTMAVFDADHVNPSNIELSDHAGPFELLNKLADDHVAESAVIVPAHSGQVLLHDIVNAVGYRYPSYSPLDFKFGSSTCT